MVILNDHIAHNCGYEMTQVFRPFGFNTEKLISGRFID